MIRNISIVLLILVALAGPASASVVVFSLVAYFGNISDQPGVFTKSGAGNSTVYTDAKPCSDIPNSIEKGFIRDYIIQSANFFELPSGFIAAVMEQESGFNPVATSPVGARGLMQLMPDTYQQLNSQTITDTSKELAKARGFDKGNGVYRQIYLSSIEKSGSPPVSFLGTPNAATDIVNTKYNTFLGTTYLRQHFDDFSRQTSNHKEFTGEQLYQVMLAAYNAGPGAVDKYNGVPTYLETQEYVKKIMARYKVYEGCMKTAASASSDAAKILEDYVRNNPITACQFTNQTPGVGGSDGCARTAQDVLGKAFPGSNAAGDGTWISTESRAGAVPNASDLTRAQEILSAGKLPVWHVVGSGSGQHWIVITDIQEEVVRFYDPATGDIQARSFLDSAGANLPGQHYFGITSKGSGPGGGANQRGYTFTPSR